VCQLEHDPERGIDALNDLTPEDRAWLAERLTEYAELLQFLHDH
jgi:hypothetical protein